MGQYDNREYALHVTYYTFDAREFDTNTVVSFSSFLRTMYNRVVYICWKHDAYIMVIRYKYFFQTGS